MDNKVSLDMQRFEDKYYIVLYKIAQVILAVWLVLAYDVLKDRSLHIVEEGFQNLRP